jgi:hypothetical protein
VPAETGGEEEWSLAVTAIAATQIAQDRPRDHQSHSLIGIQPGQGSRFPVGSNGLVLSEKFIMTTLLCVRHYRRKGEKKKEEENHAADA